MAIGADHGADHPEHRFAQRRSEHRLADKRRRGRRPRGFAEFKREGDPKGDADGGPHSQAEQERGRQGAQPFPPPERCLPG